MSHSPTFFFFLPARRLKLQLSFFLCAVRKEEEEYGPPGWPRLHPHCARSGPGRSFAGRAEWKHQSAHCRAAKPVGQSWTCNCQRALKGNVPSGHRKGVAGCKLCTHLTNAATLTYSNTLTLPPLYPVNNLSTLPSFLTFGIQVQSNEPNAVYSLVQKERELKFPFQITEDGEIHLTEELDREEKDMVHNTCLVWWMNLFDPI